MNHRGGIDGGRQCDRGVVDSVNNIVWNDTGRNELCGCLQPKGCDDTRE
jgi:hypothetical protein